MNSRHLRYLTGEKETSPEVWAMAQLTWLATMVSGAWWMEGYWWWMLVPLLVVEALLMLIALVNQ